MNEFNILKSYDLEVDKQIKETEEFYQFPATISTTDNVDRDNDVIVAGAFDDFLASKYSEQIPMLYGHLSTQLLGHWKNLRMVGKKLKADGYIVKDATLPQEVMPFIKSGSLKGVSIGFVVKEWSIDEDRAPWGFNFLNVEVFEASLTPIPANPNAQINKSSSGVLYLDDNERARLYFNSIIKAFNGGS